MPKSISSINQGIGICKAIFQSIIRRIYVDKVNFASVRLFKQLQRSKVIPLDEKIHFAAVVDKKAAVLGQHWRMGSQPWR